MPVIQILRFESALGIVGSCFESSRNTGGLLCLRRGIMEKCMENQMQRQVENEVETADKDV